MRGGPTLAERLARLEERQVHLNTDVDEIKSDMKVVRAYVEKGVHQREVFTWLAATTVKLVTLVGITVTIVTGVSGVLR